MKHFIYFISIFTLVFILACSNKQAKIQILVANAPTEIIIDESDTIVIKTSLDSIDVSLGRHKILFNNKLDNFYVDEKGGLFNLNQKGLVVLQIEFEAEQTENTIKYNTHLRNPNFVIVDSFLIFRKGFKRLIEDSSALQETVKQVMAAKNGNYAPLSEKETIYEGNDYDTNQKVWGFKRIGTSQLYVPKFWDYDLGEKIPESIIVRRHKNQEQLFGQVPELKTVLLLEEDFLDYVESMPNTYELVDVSDLMLGLL